MRMFATVVGGTIAIVVGGSLLLFALPGSFIQNPRLHGTDYWFAAAGRLFAPDLARLTTTGMGLVLAGVVLNLYEVFPRAGDMSLSRVRRLALFCGLALLGSLGLMGVLVGITFSTLGLD